MSTTNTRPQPTGSRPRAGGGDRPPGRPARRSRPRRGPHASSAQRARSTTRRTTPVRADEITPRTSSDHLDAYARLFRSALEQALDRLPADGGGLMLARSRAALRTYDLTRGLLLEESERVRLDVTRTVADERGIERLRGAPLSSEITPDDPQARRVFRRGVPVEGARVRLGGRKR
ncbi:hypothetical protein KUV85_00685 [Nocardioides panacisoli]|uniref:hypothetical protein n=1 Tax=Nocardioides panacisoli TaxID=627624 RepID=UPI001C63057F|nr:hypothetical protein [Nocardioides panacisoli]QYJ04230.1 hypothetical protein KUV85_00685 [Nocardioides panacisoli]